MHLCHLPFPRLARGGVCGAVLLVTVAVVACGGARDKPVIEDDLLRARPTASPPKSLLAGMRAVEARGRRIAAYERATAAASALLLASNADTSLFDTYLAVPEGNAWHVYFGRLTADGSAFDAAFAFDCEDSRCAPGSPPADSTSIAPLARAIKTASGAFSPKAAAYDAVVFEESNGTISVYVVPGNTVPEVVLLGGDYRISMSANGVDILKVVELHHSVLELPSSVPAGVRAAGTIRTSPTSDLPVGTDVSFIMRNPHLAPQTVIGPRWATRIGASGEIEFLGETKELLSSKAVTSP